MGANHKDLADYLEGTRFGIRSLLSYASQIDVKPIRYGDLLQVIWYTATMTRKQYQIWRRTRGSFKQYKRDINSVNSVRLFAAMQIMTLDQLAVW
jgi:hypothetical protein